MTPTTPDGAGAPEFVAMPGSVAELDGDAVEQLLRVGARLATAQPVELDPGRPLLVSRADDGSVQVTDLRAYIEPYASHPNRRAGITVLHDLDDFVHWVNRQGNPDRTTVWLTELTRTFTAIFNDHVTDGDTGGWRDDRASYQVRVDPEWAAWKAISGKLVNQKVFARFLEDHMDAITEPDGQTIFRVASTFQAQASVKYHSAVRLDNGAVQLFYQEEISPSAGRDGDLKVPESFALELEPFTGAVPAPVTARLRYDINRDTRALQLGIDLVRIDDIERQAFTRIRDLARELLRDSFPVYLGEAPAAAAPTRPRP